MLDAVRQKLPPKVQAEGRQRRAIDMRRDSPAAASPWTEG